MAGPCNGCNCGPSATAHIAFRGFDSNGGGARFPNYLEMDLDQYVYMNGEVVRLFRYPDGPDSEFFFYTLQGKRRCYFDTTATAHALDEKVYIVEPRPAGDILPANGLPVFPVFYENDDDADRQLETDSRLLFTAPADGDYLVRVTDTRNFGGPDFVYRLTIQPAKPDFSVKIEEGDANIPAGSGRDFTVKLTRIDGFDGPVRVDIAEPSAGFRVSSPIIIEAGQSEASGTVYAMPDAPITSMPATTAEGLKVTATATVEGESVNRSLPDMKRPWSGLKSPIVVTLEPFEPSPATRPTHATRPADAAPRADHRDARQANSRLAARCRRDGYKGPVIFDAKNLPHGVGVADVGLSGVQILEDQSERKIFIQCAPWVAEMDRPCHLRVREAANPTTPPVTIHVRRQGGEEHAGK